MQAPDELPELMARTALGDRSAFSDLYDCTSAKLFGVLIRLLRDRSEAEDALQEVYVKVWRHAGGFRGENPDSAMAFVVTIARRHGIDRIRARRKPHQPIDEAHEFADSAPSPEAQAISGSEQSRIDHCMDRLESDRAEAVRAAYVEGFAYQELATRFDIPLNTMRTWLRRSLLKLRECLEE